MFLVLIANSFWEINSCAAGVVGHFLDCTLGIVVKLFISCCSPVSVVAKQNDLAAAAYLCVSGVTVQCSCLHVSG